ncbi:TrmH family RNA methyltransferase [Bacillus sp. V33-4]|uniref:TrmH family RNA methyltransferase n=1 Tax=Bacillus sp. V33-4 TaxID=2054169 RepID=UPI000C75FCD8|nr:RNA methyltransferase [Bacillus sp. V33-4]PLR82370.1 RNA methyltransferase [Bacillus sp. V33-4]
MKHIHSLSNPQVKQWKKLLTKKERDKTRTFLVEGFHLVEEALASDGRVLELIVSEDTDIPTRWNYGETPITTVTAEIIKAISDTEAPQGVLAVCQQEQAVQPDFNGRTFLLIDAVQDPGNLGTMIRTADAAGLDVVVVGDGSVDMYNPKVLRSAQGSHFHLPVIRASLFEWLDKLQGQNIPVYGTALENGVNFSEVTPRESFALLVGNEGSGVNRDLLEKTTKNLFIPIHGKSESLNVAVAAGILLYYLKK